MDDVKATLHTLQLAVTEVGRRLVVYFVGDGSKISLQTRFEGKGGEASPELTKAAERIAMLTLQSQIEDFDQKNVCDGSVMIEEYDVWLSGASQTADWNYDRSVDISDLEDAAEVDDPFGGQDPGVSMEEPTPEL